MLEGDNTVHIAGTTKGREQIQKFKETRGSRYICQNELENTRF